MSFLFANFLKNGIRLRNFHHALFQPGHADVVISKFVILLFVIRYSSASRPRHIPYPRPYVCVTVISPPWQGGEGRGFLTANFNVDAGLGDLLLTGDTGLTKAASGHISIIFFAHLHYFRAVGHAQVFIVTLFGNGTGRAALFT